MSCLARNKLVSLHRHFQVSVKSLMSPRNNLDLIWILILFYFKTLDFGLKVKKRIIFLVYLREFWEPRNSGLWIVRGLYCLSLNQEFWICWLQISENKIYLFLNMKFFFAIVHPQTRGIKNSQSRDTLTHSYQEISIIWLWIFPRLSGH